MTTIKSGFAKMEQRIRFGSDGNGIFVALSVTGGKSWRHVDSVQEFEALDHRVWLLPDEYRAAVAYLNRE